jgi:hypothetical protein
MAIAEELSGVSRRVEFDRDEGIMRATRTVRESGNSVIVTLPPQIVEGANFEVGDDVNISVDIDTGVISVTRNETDEDE